MNRREMRQITQRTGARVFIEDPPGVIELGTVTGHYDDDMVFVTFDGSDEPVRVWTTALMLLKEEDGR